MPVSADWPIASGNAVAAQTGRTESPVRVFGVAIIFYALAFLGVFSSFDAALFLLLAALFARSLRPFLLLLAASVQDAPGLSYLWSYIGFAGVGALMLLDAALWPPARERRASLGPVERVVVMAAALVAYGIFVAWAQSALGGHPQSGDRPYPVVGALTILMILTGYYSRLVLDLGESNRRLIGALCLLALAHALAIGVLQIPFGQEIYRSGTSLAQAEATRALVEAGAIGFARINGPFLSPNTFGYTILLLAMIATVTLFDTARWRVAFVYAVAGAAAVMLSMSKAVLGFYGLSGLVLSYFVIGRARTILLVVAALLALPFVLSSETIQLVFDVFRVQEDTLGTRQWAWSAAIENLHLIDWLAGIGVGAWPVFFERLIGEPLADPHALLLSLPGSYGILGVVFYVLLLWTVLRVPVSKANGDARRLGKFLLILLLLVKDLASIPSVLGNTPVTYLVWLYLGLVLCDPAAAPVPARAGAMAAPRARGAPALATGGPPPGDA